jgi:hypothetical protein
MFVDEYFYLIEVNNGRGSLNKVHCLDGFSGFFYLPISL